MSAKAITEGIKARMSGDGALTALLGSLAGKPSIVMSNPVPPGMPRPFVVSDGNVSTRKEPGKNDDVRNIFRDISAYTDASGDTGLVEEIIDIIHDLFHHEEDNVTIEGFTLSLITCTDAIVAPSSEDLYGRMVTVRMQLAK